MTKLNTIIASLLVFATMLSNPVQAEEPSSKAEFNQAYKSYQSLSDAGKWDEALPHAKNAYELGQTLYADKPETKAALADNYALNLMKLDYYKQARSVLFDALSLYESINGKNSTILIPLLKDISLSFALTNQALKSKSYTKRALALSKNTHGEDSPEYGQLLVDVGLIAIKSRNPRLIKKYFYAGHSILSKTLGEDHPRTGIAAFNIGKFELANGKPDQSVDYLLSALSTFEFPDRPANVYQLSTHGFLAEAYERLERSEKATEHCLAIGRMSPETSTQNYLPIVKMAPVYPPDAIDFNRQGIVTMKFDVDELGFVRDPVVVENTTKSIILEKASIEAILKYRYAPRFINGESVVSKAVQTSFNYQLQR